MTLSLWPQTTVGHEVKGGGRSWGLPVAQRCPSLAGFLAGSRVHQWLGAAVGWPWFQAPSTHASLLYVQELPCSGLGHRWCPHSGAGPLGCALAHRGDAVPSVLALWSWQQGPVQAPEGRARDCSPAARLAGCGTCARLGEAAAERLHLQVDTGTLVWVLPPPHPHTQGVFCRPQRCCELAGGTHLSWCRGSSRQCKPRLGLALEGRALSPLQARLCLLRFRFQGAGSGLL